MAADVSDAGERIKPLLSMRLMSPRRSGSPTPSRLCRRLTSLIAILDRQPRVTGRLQTILIPRANLLGVEVEDGPVELARRVQDSQSNGAVAPENSTGNQKRASRSLPPDLLQAKRDGGKGGTQTFMNQRCQRNLARASEQHRP